MIRLLKVIVELAAKVVNAPVDRVVAPIAVLLIPVMVVLKLEEVIVNELAPVLIAEALSPDMERFPEVAVKFSAPVVCFKPLEAVSNPVEVVVPVMPRLPVTDASVVTERLFSVASPDVETVESEVLPVTPSVPPTVALFVTVALFKVASPEVVSVEREVLPMTLNVPPIPNAPVPTKL